MTQPYQLSNGIQFIPHSLTQPFSTEAFKAYPIPKDLPNVLADPAHTPAVHPRLGSIYLGAGAFSPKDPTRYPIWFPSSQLCSHLLIAGMIGSGKTTLLSRLIAGALNTFGTVVLSEAKAGQFGGEQGAAFTNLAAYLNRKFPDLTVLRWPRGGCWFNPLLYLKSETDRRIFLANLANQIVSQQSITGDIVAFIHNAGSIAELILSYLQHFQDQDPLTLRTLVGYLKNPTLLATQLEQRAKQLTGGRSRQLQDLKHQLTMLNFFYLDKPEFAMTRHGVNLLIHTLDHEDLLTYSEPNPDLVELSINDILYQRSLVIVSQPLHDPASAVVGPLLWDSLLTRIIELGPDPERLQGKPRQKVLAVLDETHRLPVGRLGESGDWLREYNVGLVEITPTIVDQNRWEQNQHVYQTLISLSPGVPAVVNLMHDKLPNFFLKPTYLKSVNTADGTSQFVLSPRSDYKHSLSEDNPGVSQRSLQMSGRYTGLLQCSALDGQGKVFWLDFEDALLANLKTLLTAATAPDCPADIHRAIDYALGLSEFVNTHQSLPG